MKVNHFGFNSFSVWGFQEQTYGNLHNEFQDIQQVNVWKVKFTLLKATLAVVKSKTVNLSSPKKK